MSDIDNPGGESCLGDIMARLSRYEARLGVANATNKATILQALAQAGVSKVTVVFDGYGDSGGIEDVQVEGQTAELSETPIAYVSAGWSEEEAEPVSHLPLKEAVDRLALDFLAQTHGGWENNDGAFGEVVIDVGAGTATLDYNERFVDSTNHSHEF